MPPGYGRMPDFLSKANADVYENSTCRCESCALTRAENGSILWVKRNGRDAIPENLYKDVYHAARRDRTGAGKDRAERMILSCRQMDWGKRYGIRYITCHAGFVPEERNEFYERFIADMKQLVRFAAANGQEFLFETGTEADEGIPGHLQEEISGGMYANEMTSVVDCVVNGKKPSVGAQDAINAMNFCFGMMESAETGKVVKF